MNTLVFEKLRQLSGERLTLIWIWIWIWIST